ncbi:uncharacterized protein N7482_004235 [Penicillium canariense]|uniref:Xylose isomerase-like TIM barrel domain-containing protein n=1 Tax=Penicillium canariense TaxID=189055 RepID=A0A9W9LPW9_9EURO|nr:uncharacterized protein N7482_004235 [Penicillium canariense]KAJ5168641.1 hypothetical protein N7482_004235 [Penicillium canariense]
MVPITFASLEKIPLSYASCSIGCGASDTLPRKLEAISKAGFVSIELSFPDILDHAEHTLGHQIAPNDFAELVPVAREIRELCDANSLTVMMLQPFSNFEGWPKGSAEREDAFKRAEGWIEIMKVVGTDLLQVGATDTPATKIHTDRATIVSDLRELGEMLAKHHFRLAYENWCWSTHAPGWRDVWEIVRAVDRPNVGLCLDTFQTAGSEWGDPTSSTGLIKGVPPDELTRKFGASMDELAQTVPPDKIYLLQISDAYKVSPPLEDKIVGGLRPRGQWSHDYRPMPYDGGYLPIEDVARAVLKTGFRGWFSMEIFDAGPQGKGKKYELDGFAKKAMENMQKLLKNCATDA